MKKGYEDETIEILKRLWSPAKGGLKSSNGRRVEFEPDWKNWE